MTTPTRAAVLFDLDGTLLDSALDFHAIVNALLIEHNRSPVTYEFLKSEVSEGARAMLCHAFALPADDELIEALLVELLARYETQVCDHAMMFPGMDELLLHLEAAGIPWGIVTNKPRRFSETILHKLALHSRCSVLVCPEDVTHTKPDPESLYLACKLTHTCATSSIYIGDHLRDIDAGNRANMFTIGALYGYIRANENTATWNADHYVTDVEQIWPVIREQTGLNLCT